LIQTGAMRKRVGFAAPVFDALRAGCWRLVPLLPPLPAAVGRPPPRFRGVWMTNQRHDHQCRDRTSCEAAMDAVEGDCLQALFIRWSGIRGYAIHTSESHQGRKN